MTRKHRLAFVAAWGLWAVLCFTLNEDVGDAYMKAFAAPGIVLFILWYAQGFWRIGSSAARAARRQLDPK